MCKLYSLITYNLMLNSYQVYHATKLSGKNSDGK